jgi:endonuclease/exonuclease/phosphatase family metal-dependent hydrolase
MRIEGSTMRRAVTIAIIAVAGLVAIVVLFLVVSTITAFRPDDELPVEALQGATTRGVAGDTLSVLTWNIGYGGLGAEADFVLDGGTMGRPRAASDVESNLAGVRQVVASSPADVLLLQEVDTRASRSYRLNEVEMLSEVRSGDAAWFALNYRAMFVPYPLRSPLGRVKSGLLTLSEYDATSATRLQLPGSYSWPLKLFYPTRCAVLVRIPSDVPGVDWCLINVHLSAYDSGGVLRAQQLDYVRDLMEGLYAEGHRVVVGGDWNSLFPGVDLDDFGPYTTAEEDLTWVQRIPDSWTPPRWQWAYDPASATCRTLEKPYVEGENLTVIIDGFLISPNLRVDDVEGLGLGFEYSDHDPVLVTVSAR